MTVIGAGQAGLSSTFHLRRLGLEHGSDLRVVDAEEGPGGAWRHRWPTLTMDRVNGIFALPDQQQDPVDDDAPARRAVPDWFATYEQRQGFEVLRPVEVTRVADATSREDDAIEGPDPGWLEVSSSIGTWRSRAVVNATGTWRRPYWPTVPGMRDFAGRQLHTHDYPGPDALRGQRVVVVGGGISGAGHVVELADVATTRWVTRRPPQWRGEEFTEEHGRAVVARVEERVRRGLRARSVVSETGLPDRGRFGQARRAGVLEARPMFDRLEPDGLVWADDSRWPADVVLWATGFRPEVDHLAPLRLRTAHGGIALDGTRAVRDRRVHLVGFGPSASTVGANRAGRAAAVELLRWLRPD